MTSFKIEALRLTFVMKNEALMYFSTLTDV